MRRKMKLIDAVEWAKKMEALGPEKCCLQSMDRDGTKVGYDIELTRAISEAYRSRSSHQRSREP